MYKGNPPISNPIWQISTVCSETPEKKSEKKDALVALFPGVGNNGTPVGKNGTHSIFGGKFRENA